MIADLSSRIRQYLQARSRREQLVLAVGAGLLLLAIAYAAIYVPFEASHRKLAERLPTMRAQHRLLMSQVEEIERLRHKASGQVAAAGDLQHRVESAAISAGLRDSIVAITPVGSDLTQVVTRDRPSEEWLRWLFELQRQGIRIQSAHMRMSADGGSGSLEMTLAGQKP